MPLRYFIHSLDQLSYTGNVYWTGKTCETGLAMLKKITINDAKAIYSSYIIS